MSQPELSAADASRLAYIASVARHGPRAEVEIRRVKGQLESAYARQVADAIAERAGIRTGSHRSELLNLVAVGFLAWAGNELLKDKPVRMPKAKRARTRAARKAR